MPCLPAPSSAPRPPPSHPWSGPSSSSSSWPRRRPRGRARRRSGALVGAAPGGHRGVVTWVACPEPSTRSTSPAWAGAAAASSARHGDGAAREARKRGIWSATPAGPRSCVLQAVSRYSAPGSPDAVAVHEQPPSTPHRGRPAGAAACPRAGAAGCGGSDSNGNEDDATALIDKAFDKLVKSADVKLDAELKIQGVPGLRQADPLQASGPLHHPEGHAAQAGHRPDARRPGPGPVAADRLPLHRRPRLPEVRRRVLRAAQGERRRGQPASWPSSPGKRRRRAGHRPRLVDPRRQDGGRARRSAASTPTTSPPAWTCASCWPTSTAWPRRGPARWAAPRHRSP